MAAGEDGSTNHQRPAEKAHRRGSGRDLLILRKCHLGDRVSVANARCSLVISSQSQEPLIPQGWLGPRACPLEGHPAGPLPVSAPRGV